MSILTYNGISLPYGQTSSFATDVVYDDSNTDWMCTRFDIRVNTVINIAYVPLMWPGRGSAAPDNAAGIMKGMRTTLMQPRKELSFNFNGTEFIPSRTAGIGTVDVQNGPKPQSFNYTQLNNTTFYVTYHIIANYWENNNLNEDTLAVTNRTGNNVLSNRWSETVEIDNCLYSRRTREGKFIIRSDNASGFIADMVRSQMAVVSVPTGFLRESSSYTVSPDGLAIQYRVTDKEVFKMPPQPAYEADGEYRETLSKGGGIRHGEVRVRLRGAKDRNLSSQARLVAVAIGIVARKLKIGGAAMLESASLAVGMYDNWVEMSARAMMNSDKAIVTGASAGYGLASSGVTSAGGNSLPVGNGGGFGGFGGSKGFSEFVCFTPRSEDGAPPPEYKDRGTAGLLLQAAKYYDPSLRDTELGTGDVWQPNVQNGARIGNSVKSQLTNGVKVGQAGIVREDT